MRLNDGIFVDKEATFGALRFSALRREEFELDEDGKVTEKVLNRTYDLKSRGQEQMIQVKIPEAAGKKDFAYNADVELINPVVGTVANYLYGSLTEVDWYIKADDIVSKGSRAQIKQSDNKHDSKTS